tara:strand:+ start:384 stop:848 length:465 start_codon:yes stop_codon:yes gene_type:complete
MASWQNQVKQIAMALAVIGGLWMALSIGVGEAVQVVVDPNDVENPLAADTLAAFGGSVDFVDRIATAGVFVTLLGSSGLAIIGISSGNPPFINTTLRYAPVIIGLIAFTAFSDSTWELISGDRTWGDFSDGANAYILFLASSMVAGAVSLLKRD